MGGLEILGFGAIGLGTLIAVIGWIWLIVLGFKHGGALWGILNILCQPITGIIFCVMHKTGWLQLAMLIIGNIIAGAGMVPLMPAIIKAMEQMK